MAFFGKMDKRITKLGQGAAQKTKAMSESVKLSGMIKDEEKKQQEFCRKLGEYYYQMCKEQAEGPLKDLCSQIDASKAVVAQCKEQLCLVKGTRSCPNCQEEAPITAAFCSACGTSLPPLSKPQVEPILPDEANCHECRAALEPDASFCVFCGTRVTAQESKPIEPSLMTLQPSAEMSQKVEVKKEDEREKEPEAEVEPEKDLMAEVESEEETATKTESQEKTDSTPTPPIAEVVRPSCLDCGEILRPESLFCTNCGKKVKRVGS